MSLNGTFIIGGIFALAATVLAVIFLLPESKKKNNKFLKFLSDLVNFKTLVIEKILKVLYIFVTAACIFVGFFMLFSGYSYGGYYGYGGFISFAKYGIALMILGPIVARIVFEIIMMFILLVQNTISINNKMPDKDKKEAPVEEPKKTPVAPAPLSAPTPETAPVQEAAPTPVQEATPVVEEVPVEPVYRFCSQCGTRYDITKGGCPNGCQK